MLVKGWVKKLTYYYMLWLEHGCLSENFTQAEHDAFMEDKDWLGEAFALPTDCVVFGKVADFRAWRPQLPA